jgi:hypothetical protein
LSRVTDFCCVLQPAALLSLLPCLLMMSKIV